MINNPAVPRGTYSVGGSNVDCLENDMTDTKSAQEILPQLTTPLTVIVEYDHGDEQADLDLKKIHDGDLVLVHAASDMYFHQLRLRVAFDPSLADKITVYSRNKDGKLEGPIGLTREHYCGPKGWWPPGFQQQDWHTETLIKWVEAKRWDVPEVANLRNKYGIGE